MVSKKNTPKGDYIRTCATSILHVIASKSYRRIIILGETLKRKAPGDLEQVMALLADGGVLSIKDESKHNLIRLKEKQEICY